MTGSLLHEVLACRLGELSGCSSPNYLQVPRVPADSLLRFWRVLDSDCHIVSQDRCLDTMATGNSLPGADRTGIDFQVNVQIPWNAPEAYVTLGSPELFMLDTARIPDVLGLRTRYPEDLNILLLQWPLSVVSGMSRKHTDYESLHHECKRCFRGEQTGCCSVCGTVIKNDMEHHFASLHLDVAQLWWCPVSWCTTWKGTPHDCMDHIRQQHLVPNSVKVANLARWFPP